MRPSTEEIARKILECIEMLQRRTAALDDRLSALESSRPDDAVDSALLDKVEKMLDDMRERVPMRTSPEIDKIAPAFAKAQAKLTNPKRNLTAKVKGRTKAGAQYEYEYKYTSLDSLLDLMRPVLGEFELFVTQGVIGDTPPYKLVTRVTHSSGQWYETDTPLPYSGSTDAQELGIAISYSRRYSLGPMVGVASEEDMDGKDPKRDVGKIKASDGAGERLDEPTRNRMVDLAAVVQDHFDGERLADAFNTWVKESKELDADAKVFAWSFLTSKARSTLKSMSAGT